MIWVKINKGCVKNDQDSRILSDIQDKYGADFNTHTKNGMWYSFGNSDNSMDFARDVIEAMPYLTVTLGESR